MLAPYAIRVFNGDPSTGDLHTLLYDLDALINSAKESQPDQPVSQKVNAPASMDSTSFDHTVPQIVITVTESLHQFEGADLESQLQTYDVFLGTLDPSVRPQIADLLMKASVKATNHSSRQRIEQAAHSILIGGRAADPYDHETAMKKYMDDQQKSFPSS
jgi:hypothetical protein